MVEFASYCNQNDMNLEQYDAANQRIGHAFETGLPLQVKAFLEAANTKIDIFLNAEHVGTGQIFTNLANRLQKSSVQHTFQTIHNSDALGTFSYTDNKLSVANNYSASIRRLPPEEALDQLETTIRSTGLHEAIHGVDTERNAFGDVTNTRAISGRPEVVEAFNRDKASFSNLSVKAARAAIELRDSSFGTYNRYAETVLDIQRQDGESLKAYGQRIATVIAEKNPDLTIVADPIGQLERSGAAPILAIAEAMGSEKMQFGELFDILEILATANVVFPQTGYSQDKLVVEAIARVPQLASIIDPQWVERYNDGLRMLQGGDELNPNITHDQLIALGERTFPPIIRQILPELSAVIIEQVLTHSYDMALELPRMREQAANIEFDDDLFSNISDFDADIQTPAQKAAVEINKLSQFAGLLSNFDDVTRGNILTYALEGSYENISSLVGQEVYDQILSHIQDNQMQPLMNILQNNGFVTVTDDNRYEFTAEFTQLQHEVGPEVDQLLDALFNNPNIGR